MMNHKDRRKSAPDIPHSIVQHSQSDTTSILSYHQTHREDEPPGMLHASSATHIPVSSMMNVSHSAPAEEIGTKKKDSTMKKITISLSEYEALTEKANKMLPHYQEKVVPEKDSQILVLKEKVKKYKETIRKMEQSVEQDKTVWLQITGIDPKNMSTSIVPLEELQSACACAAAFRGDVLCLTTMIQNGADLSKPNYDTKTPLLHYNCVEFLLQNGAIADVKDVSGQTPLYLSILNKHADVASIIELAITQQCRWRLSKYQISANYIYPDEEFEHVQNYALFNLLAKASGNSPRVTQDYLDQNSKDHMSPKLIKRKTLKSRKDQITPDSSELLISNSAASTSEGTSNTSNSFSTSTTSIFANVAPCNDHQPVYLPSCAPPPTVTSNTYQLQNPLPPLSTQSPINYPASTSSSVGTGVGVGHGVGISMSVAAVSGGGVVQSTSTNNILSQNINIVNNPTNNNNSTANNNNNNNNSQSFSSPIQSPYDNARPLKGLKKFLYNIKNKKSSETPNSLGVSNSEEDVHHHHSSSSSKTRKSKESTAPLFGEAFGRLRGECSIPYCDCKYYSPSDDKKEKTMCSCGHWPANHKDLGLKQNVLVGLDLLEKPKQTQILVSKNEGSEWPKIFNLETKEDGNTNNGLSSLQHDLLQKKPEWVIDAHDVIFLSELGQGTSAKVYKGTYENMTVAIKVMEFSLGSKQIVDLKKELEIMLSIRSEHILYLYGIIIQPRLSLVIEYCAKKSLYHALSDEAPAETNINTDGPSNSIDWALLLNWFKQSVQGILVLHKFKPQIVHRDIKSLNLLITSDNQIKIADFGLSRFLKVEDSLSTLNKLRGTYCYTSPEVYFGKTYTIKSDIYSLGVVLWEMVYRYVNGSYAQPYSEYSSISFDFQIIIQVAKNNLRPTIPVGTPPLLSKLISILWSSKPEDRPTTNQLLDVVVALEKHCLNHKELWESASYKNKNKEEVLSDPLWDELNIAEYLTNLPETAEEVVSDQPSASNSRDNINTNNNTPNNSSPRSKSSLSPSTTPRSNHSPRTTISPRNTVSTPSASPSPGNASVASSPILPSSPKTVPKVVLVSSNEESKNLLANSNKSNNNNNPAVPKPENHIKKRKSHSSDSVFSKILANTNNNSNTATSSLPSSVSVQEASIITSSPTPSPTTPIYTIPSTAPPKRRIKSNSTPMNLHGIINNPDIDIPNMLILSSSSPPSSSSLPVVAPFEKSSVAATRTEESSELPPVEISKSTTSSSSSTSSSTSTTSSSSKLQRSGRDKYSSSSRSKSEVKKAQNPTHSSSSSSLSPTSLAGTTASPSRSNRRKSTELRHHHNSSNNPSSNSSSSNSLRNSDDDQCDSQNTSPNNHEEIKVKRVPPSSKHIKQHKSPQTSKNS
eukprot:TRINITY_DN610_c0_g1_i1.p1 TRINITY_DN610_c0_g1~~TRINITY_DN610_c0_g1_i1.p1  ORF type:complete len:1379 (-),score=333.22 TRINITY_DN610_c0_g1_i1:172-4308(-)